MVGLATLAEVIGLAEVAGIVGVARVPEEVGVAGVVPILVLDGQVERSRSAGVRVHGQCRGD